MDGFIDTSIYPHSSLKETQPVRSCISFGEDGMSVIIWLGGEKNIPIS